MEGLAYTQDVVLSRIAVLGKRGYGEDSPDVTKLTDRGPCVVSSGRGVGDPLEPPPISASASPSSSE